MKDKVRNFYIIFTDKTYAIVEAIWLSDAQVYADTLYNDVPTDKVVDASTFHHLKKTNRFTERKEHARTSN